MTEVVAGITMKQVKPRVWDSSSSYYLPDLTAIMVSYSDFHKMPAQRKKAMDMGLHALLGVPDSVKVYLDNGAFYFLTRSGETPRKEYEEFVKQARPDWYPIPQDFIPTPQMTLEEQRLCMTKTMEVNLAYTHDGFVPVVHISQLLEEYTIAVRENEQLATKPIIALGGIVPNLLKAPKAMKAERILEQLRHVREVFQGQHIHVFGIGGTATLHLAVLLGIDSVDSSGWRNRAARGIIQLPGSGERTIANLGNWKGRVMSEEELTKLETCQCPACKTHGIAGLKANKDFGFFNRATHNLWVLLEEVRWIKNQLEQGTYKNNYQNHLDNTIYRVLIEQIVDGQASEA